MSAGPQGDGAGDAAAAAGIRRIAVPTPFMVGHVNAYLIEDEPLTLVDSGPNSATALDALEHALAELGHRIEDIGLMIITHQHVDHVGLAEVIARRSGAEVAALEALAPYLESFRAAASLDDAFAASFMLRYGVPRDLVTALRSVAAAYQAWGSSVRVTRPLAPGSSIRLRDRELQVRHAPGHSPSDTLLWDPARAVLLASDHLISHITSNAVISRPLGAPAQEHPPRPRSLLDYEQSLRATRELPVELVLPGHGEPFGDHRALIDERLRLFERRARRMGRMIAERPRSAFDIAREMWGEVAITQTYLTISEVVGHADMLVRDGVVREREHDDVVIFEAA